MIYFTKYAEEKFDILNAHKVFIRKEEVERTIDAPDTLSKMNGLFAAQRSKIKVIYQKESNIKKVITFYPV